MFIGRKGAKRLSQSRQGDEAYRMLKIAKKKERLGISPDTIKTFFGWERGADGFWRYEINESEEINRSELEKILQGERPLAEVLHYPRLFRAYPELHEFHLSARETKDYDGLEIKKREIYLSKHILIDHLSDWEKDSVGKEHRFRSCILHEAQHFIQYTEGFARGSSVDEAMHYHNPPLLRIKAYCLPWYVFYTSVAAWIDIQSLKKGGIDNMRQNIDRYEKRYGHTWLGRMITDSVRSIIDHCEPEAYDQLLDIFEMIKQTTNPEWKTACLEQYGRFAGEVEARNAACREVDPECRTTLAETSEDIDREQQLISFSSMFCPTVPEWAETRRKNTFPMKYGIQESAKRTAIDRMVTKETFVIDPRFWEELQRSRQSELTANNK